MRGRVAHQTKLLPLPVPSFSGRLAMALSLLLTLTSSTPAEQPQIAPATSAPLAAPLASGDVAVSGFSGVKLHGDSIAPGVQPVDQTVLDPNGISLRVWDLKSVGGPFAGQSVNPLSKLEIRAQYVGQVFAVAIDAHPQDPARVPNLYAAATAAYGLHIVNSNLDKNGQIVRLKSGAPKAKFMDGQFGLGGGPGTIWKIDGATGTATKFADVLLESVANSGPGIGDIAYHPASTTLYVADLDTGLIHRFNEKGIDLGQYDHGTTGRTALKMPPIADDGKRADITSPSFKSEDPMTWGFSQPERRVTALAVHNSSLYYAIAAGPEIFSVGLNADGSFTSEISSEILVKAERPAPVTDMLFDSKGRLTLAIRGAIKPAYDFSRFTDPGSGQVLRYLSETPDDPATPDAWVPEPQEYAVGISDAGKSAAGGVSLAHSYGPDGVIDFGSCEGTLAATGNALVREPPLHGVQLSALDMVLPAKAPPAQSAFIDYDGKPDDSVGRGLVGDVEAIRNCAGAQGFPPVVEGGPAVGGFPPVVGEPGAASGGASSFPPVVQESAPTGQMPPVVESPEAPGQNLPPVVDEAPGGGQGQGTPKTSEATNADGIKVTKKGPATCTEGVACAFEITVENMTDKEIAGEVIVNDVLTAAAGPMTGATLVGGPDAPWQCAGTGADVGCRHPGPLAAKSSLPPLKLSFKLGPAGSAKEIKNCAFVKPKVPGVPAPDKVPQTPAPDQKDELPPLDGVLTKGDAGKAPDAAAGPEPPIIYGGVVPPATPPSSGPAVTGPVRICRKEFCLVIEDVNNPQFVPFHIESETPDDVYNVRHGSLQTELKIGIGSSQPRDVDLSVQGCARNFTGSICGEWEVFNLARLDQCVAYADETRRQIAAAPEACKGQWYPEGASDWSPDLGQHLQWCLRDGDAQTVKATERQRKLDSCKAHAVYCEKYTREAMEAVAKNKKFQCGQDSTVAFVPTEYFHRENCLRGDRHWADQQTRNRSQIINACIKDRVGDVQTKIPGDVMTADKTPAPAPQPGPQPAPQQPSPPQACVTIPIEQPQQTAQTGDLRVLKTRTVENCNADGGGCRFEIAIGNASDKPLSGPFVIEDEAKVDGAFIGAMVITEVENGVGSTWTCEKSNQTFRCTETAPLPPKKELTVRLTFKPGGGLGTPKQIENCATISGTTNKSCATIPLQPPVADQAPQPPIGRQVPKGPTDVFAAKPNIVIGKRAINKHCPLTGPCQFEILISNDGGADYKGNIVIYDWLKSNQKTLYLPTHPPAIACAGDGSFKNNHTCTLENVSLAAGRGMSFVVDVIPSFSPGDTDPVLRNCATFLAAKSSGNDPNDKSADNEACDDALLDPFNVKVEKTADQSCRAGSECNFNIRLFNDGPVDHDAPVTITDGLEGVGTAPIVSITPPLPCAEQPTALPFVCSSAGNHPLKVGAQETFAIKIRLPENTPQKFKNCAFVDPAKLPTLRTASMALAESGSRKGAYDCKEVSVAPATDDKSSAAPSECSGGMVPDAGGRCACPPGTAWTGRNCATGTAGSDRVQPSNSPVPETTCIGLMVVGADGRCACPPDTTWNGRSCVGGTAGSDRVQQKPDGLPPVKPPPAKPRPKPDGGSSGSDRSKSIPDEPDEPKCKNGMIITSAGCACPRGEKFRKGRCRKKQDEPPKCPPGTSGKPPECCPPGTYFKNGVCFKPQKEPKQQEVECPDGSIKIARICIKLPKKKDKQKQEPEQQAPSPPAPDQGLPPVQKIPKGPVTAPPDGGLPPLKLKCPKGEARNATGQCVPQGPN